MPSAVGGRPFRAAMGTGRCERHRPDSGAALAGPGRRHGRFGRVTEQARCTAMAACCPAAATRRAALAVGLATLAVSTGREAGREHGPWP